MFKEATGGRRLFPGQEPVHEWATLQHGDCVHVWSNGSFLYPAFVDLCADNGQVIWVIEHGTGSRRLFVRGDPVTLYTS
ncbi:MAG: hypothetical protein K0R37_2607 [Arthrobacter sp.]|jgi:hypothetical protein|nr:hypothetical protein [Arthrobacter sp.]